MKKNKEKRKSQWNLNKSFSVSPSRNSLHLITFGKLFLVFCLLLSLLGLNVFANGYSFTNSEVELKQIIPFDALFRYDEPFGDVTLMLDYPSFVMDGENVNSSVSILDGNVTVAEFSISQTGSSIMEDSLVTIGAYEGYYRLYANEFYLVGEQNPDGIRSDADFIPSISFNAPVSNVSISYNLYGVFEEVGDFGTYFEIRNLASNVTENIALGSTPRCNLITEYIRGYLSRCSYLILEDYFVSFELPLERSFSVDGVLTNRDLNGLYRGLEIDNSIDEMPGALDWLFDSVGSVLSVELFGGFSIGVVLAAIIAIPLVIMILKFFFGG